jgi:hypothetical protein
MRYHRPNNRGWGWVNWDVQSWVQGGCHWNTSTTGTTVTHRFHWRWHCVRGGAPSHHHAVDASRGYRTLRCALLATTAVGTFATTTLVAITASVTTSTINATPSSGDSAVTTRRMAVPAGLSHLHHTAGDRQHTLAFVCVHHDRAMLQVVSTTASKAREPPSIAAARRYALEALGIYKDEVAASVLCFGPLVYRKGSERFDHVARHARLGESSRLIQHQLRDAMLERPAARRVTIFENLTPYLDYVDALIDRGIRDEIAVCASGQASWAVVRLIELSARHALPMRFAGDLDRSGVLILRSLRKRTGARIEPLCMGAATHRRFADRGQPISAREATLLTTMLAADPPDAPCHPLLAELDKTGVWVEQEAFAGDCLARVLTG